MSYKIEEIADNTFRFDENGKANCYLVVGSEKALLIDGCWGIGDLKGTIRTLTDKPIIAAATHRHPDHTCGLRQLGDYYVSEKDNILFNRILENRLFGMAMVMAVKQKIQSYHNKKMGKPLPLHDRDIFDIGNRCIEVQEIPGHTAGSVMFIDHTQKLLFTGDDVNSRLWMQGRGATSLAEWRIGAKKVLDYMSEGYSAWTGHLDGRQTQERLLEIYGLVEEIIEKKEQLSKKDSPYSKTGEILEVRFNIHKIDR